MAPCHVLALISLRCRPAQYRITGYLPADNLQQDAGLISRPRSQRGERICWVGLRELPADFRSEPVIDCARRLVIPA
jgi:hypothetical protein